MRKKKTVSKRVNLDLEIRKLSRSLIKGDDLYYARCNNCRGSGG
jgi:hypothetical protein